MYYSSIGALALVIHIIINFEALKKPSYKKNNETAYERYRSFLYAVTMFYVADFLWGFLYDNKWIIAVYIDTAMFLVFMALLVFLWTRFVVNYLENNRLFGRILEVSGGLILIYQILALICNLFYPIMYKFAEDGEYLPGRGRYFSLGLQMILYFATTLYVTFRNIKADRTERMYLRTVGVSSLAMTVFIVLQSFYPLMPFYSIGCLLATCLIHSFLYKYETDDYERRISREKQIAHKDSLTGVKNKLAYLDAQGLIEVRSQKGALGEYGVIVFDVNDLKSVNDTKGHAAGDECIKEACSIICKTFKHSPVFRIGGDEFVAILEGSDYDQRMQLLSSFEEMMDNNLKKDGIVVASGLAEYNPLADESYTDVFKRADKRMYLRKEQLKETQA